MTKYSDNPLLVDAQAPTDAQILEYLRDRTAGHRLATGGRSTGIDERLHTRFKELLTALGRIAKHPADVTGATAMAEIAQKTLQGE